MNGTSRSVVAVIAFAAILPLAAVALLSPAAFSLHAPLNYQGDGLSHAVLVKSLLEFGWFPVVNARLGAPFGSTTFDYPNADAANLLLLKVIGIFSGDWIVVANVFYLATFALASVAAFVVMYRLGVERLYAIVGALLFAELPYHFLRANHLLLAAYWAVPFGVYLAISCGHQAFALRERDAWRGNPARALLAIAVACGGIYYAFFTIVLVIAAGAANSLALQRWRALLPALGVTAIILMTVGIEFGPTFRYWYLNGTNKEIAERSAAETETYALKPVQLLFPQREHRLPFARKFAIGYASSTPLVNENATASLGVVGAAGLAIVLLWAFRRMAADGPPAPPFESMAMLAIVALVLGMVGGAGSLIGYAGFTSIRAYNRISVFLGFIGIAAACMSMQRTLSRLCKTHVRARTSIAAAVVLAVFGTLDQLPFSLERSNAEFEGDRRFFSALERLIAPGTAVYQIPYHPYPESGPVNNMDDYRLALGYLHTATLRWSYGAMKGRAEDLWFRSLATRDMDEQLRIAAQNGFGAVYIDRRAYVDRGEAVEAILRGDLGQPIVVSDDRNLAVYRLLPPATSPSAVRR